MSGRAFDLWTQNTPDAHVITHLRAQYHLSASAMEIIRKNVELNSSTALSEISPRPLVLDWEGESLPAEISEGVDLVVYVSNCMGD